MVHFLCAILYIVTLFNMPIQYYDGKIATKKKDEYI